EPDEQRPRSSFSRDPPAPSGSQRLETARPRKREGELQGFAKGGLIVIGQPEPELQDRSGQERLGVEDLLDLLDLPPGRRLPSDAEDHADETPTPEGNARARSPQHPF